MVIIPNNGTEVAGLAMAAMRVGAIAVPLNFMLRAPEIKYIVENCSPKVIFTDKHIFGNSIRDKSLLPGVERWVFTGMAGEAPKGFESLDVLLEGCPKECEPADISKDDVVAIFYTSGTTGFPKGAMLTSKGFLGANKTAAALLPIGKKDFGVLCLPIAHMFGFGVSILGTAAGTKAYVMRYFDPHKVLEVMEKYKATIFVGVPAMYSFILGSNPEKYDISHMRLWGSSADAMSPDHIEKLKQYGAFLRLGPFKTKPLFAEAYGMVELSAMCTLKPALPWIKFPPGCVGWPVPPIRTRVVGENGNRLKRGEVGELVVKGPTVMAGYWNNPEETRECFIGEWFRTGDMAKKDRWGRIHFVDRKKDVIKSGGYSIFSVEVEEELLAHPDVEEAAVIGVPHPEMKEVPVGVVSVREGSNVTPGELVEWCTENIAKYKAPRRIEIIPREEMPYGTTLKVMKKDLRERFKDL